MRTISDWLAIHDEEREAGLRTSEAPTALDCVRERPTYTPTRQLSVAAEHALTKWASVPCSCEYPGVLCERCEDLAIHMVPTELRK